MFNFEQSGIVFKPFTLITGHTKGFSIWHDLGKVNAINKEDRDTFK